jgi:putative membrane protein
VVRFLAQLFLTAALLLIVAGLVSGVQVDSWGSAILAALVLGMVNAVVRPLMLILTLPLTVVTFGLFLLVINGLMLQLMAALVPGVQIGGFGSALVGALLLTLMNVLVSVLVGEDDERRR